MPVSRLRQLVGLRKAMTPRSRAPAESPVFRKASPRASTPVAFAAVVGCGEGGQGGGGRKELDGVSGSLEGSKDGVTEEEKYTESKLSDPVVGAHSRKRGMTTTEVATTWDYFSRPEIRRKDLAADAVLDDRHQHRSVKCVVWSPPPSADSDGQLKKRPREKFALKIVLRGKNDRHSRRVFNEKEVMLTLGDNQWHTRLVNTFKSDTNLYLLMEYAPQKSLDQHIEWGRGVRRGGLNSARFYTACVLNAIEHMHQHGVVHRDIKPANMLLDSDGYVKLCDYGLAKFLEPGQTTRTFLGTLAYIPPEQVNGDPYDHATDLWSLGISLYEMCYGTTPFEPNEMVSDSVWRTLTMRNIKNAHLRFPSERMPLPARLFIKSMLARPPQDRLRGHNLTYDAIHQHPFFTKFDWKALEERQLPLTGVRSSSVTPTGKGP